MKRKDFYQLVEWLTTQRENLEERKPHYATVVREFREATGLYASRHNCVRRSGS